MSEPTRQATILDEVTDSLLRKPDTFQLDIAIYRLEAHLSIPNGDVARRFFSDKVELEILTAAKQGDRSRVLYGLKSYIQVEKNAMIQRFNALLSD